MNIFSINFNLRYDIYVVETWVTRIIIEVCQVLQAALHI